MGDPFLNHAVGGSLNLELDDIDDGEVSKSDLDSAWHSFTDGCAEHSLTKKGFIYAGWAFAIVPRGSAEGEAKHLIISGAGPVVSLRKSCYFIGAERYSSSVAELYAVVELLL